MITFKQFLIEDAFDHPVPPMVNMSSPEEKYRFLTQKAAMVLDQERQTLRKLQNASDPELRRRLTDQHTKLLAQARSIQNKRHDVFTEETKKSLWELFGPAISLRTWPDCYEIFLDRKIANDQRLWKTTDTPINMKPFSEYMDYEWITPMYQSNPDSIFIHNMKVFHNDRIVKDLQWCALKD